MKIKQLFKFIVLLIFFLAVFYIFEYGFNFDSLSKLIVPFLLSVLTLIMFFKPKFKRYSLYLSGLFLVLMILSNSFKLSAVSNISSSFGFSLLVVTIFLYLPQIIKKGHVEEF